MYSKIVLDALVETASDKEISRMVVVINEWSPYRDYADMHKNDPQWWEQLANKVYTESPFPKMALAPYLIAAGQNLIAGADIREKVVPLVGKAMTIDEQDDAVQTLAKTVMAVEMKVGTLPPLKEMREAVMPRLLRTIKRLDERLTYHE